MNFVTQHKQRFVILLSLIVIVGVWPLSCKKKKNEDLVPNTYVNFDISLSDPSYTDLNSVGGWVYVAGGVRGIIIFRRSIDEFYAYERNCTYQPSDACARVMVMHDNVTAIDSCCGSKFSLFDAGLVIQAPAKRALKQYTTTFTGTIIHVQNSN